ncbi:hypothetical protein NPIL_214371 [Nephila pilipes]|uniref:Uncharacterized protein n=1 Tax=Nephila pilipes TaxID=299642 RepID=A0A8X6Q3D5_NEPPI|nr:hypothetical protein NPIL_214371 [Nephila pilipes]
MNKPPIFNSSYHFVSTTFPFSPRKLTTPDAFMRPFSIRRRLTKQHVQNTEKENSYSSHVRHRKWILFASEKGWVLKTQSRFQGLFFSAVFSMYLFAPHFKPPKKGRMISFMKKTKVGSSKEVSWNTKVTNFLQWMRSKV